MCDNRVSGPELITKLKLEIETLLPLLISTYVEYLYVRPLIADLGVRLRLETDSQGAGFNHVGRILYWNFIQRLVKIWDDKDKHSRNISIRKIVGRA